MSDVGKPFFVDGWRIEPVRDTCWGDDGEEYECISYDMFDPDGNWAKMVSFLSEIQQYIDERKHGETTDTL